VRYFFEITYNGKNYNGWQSQLNAVGIQTVVEDALSRVSQTPTKIIASGRTDTGVHCERQYFHADVEQEFNRDQFIIKLNSLLPRDIAINDILPVKADANARYDALERTYRYEITRRKNPLREGYAWHYFKPVNVQTMNEAAALLVGEQDFECFSKVNTDVNHFLCEIKNVYWQEEGDSLTFYITANRFLRSMVRAIIGTLLDVGSGKITTKEFEAIIKSKDRKKAGTNVPPYGLYLVKVKYPPEIFI
jgi:tRNA pseudouridine38-40 synthase